MRRTYYDHEPAYQRIQAAGGGGWDDLSGAADSYDALAAFLASPLRPTPGAQALDLGCGGGQSSILLARAGCRTTGIDYSPTAISMAAANALEAGLQIRFLAGDCLDLSRFADHTFDLAADNHTLHCIIGPDRAVFLREAARILKPGGILFSYGSR